MDPSTPAQRGSALADLLAQFGSQQSATSAHSALKARKESSLAVARKDSVARPSKSLGQQPPPNFPKLPSLERDPADSSTTDSVTQSFSAPSQSVSSQGSPKFLDLGFDTSEEDDDSNEETGTKLDSPSHKPSARIKRRNRRPHPQLEGLIMERRRADLSDAPRRSTRKKNDILVSDTVYYYPGTPSSKRKSTGLSPRKPDTARRRLWDDIYRKTQAKANGFLVANQHLFLPLLPRNNYISKLVSDGQKASAVAYERLPAQPKGVTATLKPYQLDGLSFLAYLHNNGFSGILSDEMGLGKTLQTLSLFQYLEEQDREKGVVSEESRPYLVICPLSVLNSWVSEAQKVSHSSNLRKL